MTAKQTSNAVSSRCQSFYFETNRLRNRKIPAAPAAMENIAKIWKMSPSFANIGPDIVFAEEWTLHKNAFFRLNDIGKLCILDAH